MKKIFFTVLTLGIAFCSTAQVKMPDLSPRTTVNQKVGLTNFELEYSRPSVRDRKVFGDVLSFGDMWRTGANKNSMITFDTDITFAEMDIKAGTYSIFTTINDENWIVYLYTDTENWGIPQEWDEEKVVVKTKINSKNDAHKKETFSITFENITTESCDLVFAWDTRRVSVPINVPSKEIALASIEETMNGPSDRDYYAAASFYLEEKMNLEEALGYIIKAIEMRGEEAFWYTRKQALIEYELGDKEAAIISAKKSLEAAKKAEYDSYIKMNEASIKEWSK